ncbi:FAD:protein FMN transferase [Peterkaempfera griseoplana]|uniref:FAD:protein FMN transferase n=1 Tax=Peterkaempfera griseoplana TaxID=66896 RepID=UPI0007C6B076|nr:FAD:protein FMN transferase [Peterkaempfera griseoplana]
MGTVFSFDIRDTGGDADPGRRAAVEAALRDAVAWLHRVDAVFSTYRHDSQISRLERGEVTVQECDPEVAEVLARCERAAEETGGWFTARPGGRLDPSGLVKGWAVERAALLLRAAGSTAHSVGGGGDIQTAGDASPGRPWRIGIADPLRPGGLAAVATGSGIAVATSGNAERGPHIRHPRTGEPAGALASLTVVARSLTEADVWATAGFAMGPECLRVLEDRPGLEALAVLPDGTVRGTSRFPLLAAAAPGPAGPGDWRQALPSALGQQ